MEPLLDTFCHARRWAGLIKKITAAKTGRPANTTRLKSTLWQSIKMAMMIRLKTCRTKLMMPFDSISDTELI